MSAEVSNISQDEYMRIHVQPMLNQALEKVAL